MRTLDKFAYPRNTFSVAEDLRKQSQRRRRTDPTVAAVAAGFRNVNARSFDGWYATNVGGSTSNETLHRWGLTSTDFDGLVLPQSGRVVGLGVVLNAARTAGTLTLGVYVEGVDSSQLITIDENNDTFVYAAVNVAFEAGEALTFVLNTSSFTPTSADIVGVYVDVVYG